jgi:hypothetical protein
LLWVLFGLSGLTAHRLIMERRDGAVRRSTANVIEISSAQGGGSL